MEAIQIEQLLEKYWEGGTSLQEEKILKQYFQFSSVPAHLQAYKSYFKDLHQQQTQPLPELSQQRIKKTVSSPTRLQLWQSDTRQWMKVAAGIVFAILGSYWLIPQSPSTVEISDAWEQDTYEDPQKAYEEVRQTLLLLSKGLRQGGEQVGSLSSLQQATALLPDETSSKK